MTQAELPFSRAAMKTDGQWLVRFLAGRDWMTAEEILVAQGREPTEAARRQIRAAASNSSGLIAGGQKGYKLILALTAEEYRHYRNWMKSQADEMTARILASDKLWYARKPMT